MSKNSESGRVSEPCHYLPQLHITTQHFLTPLKLSDHFLREHYLEKKLSARQIANLTGRSKAYVFDALKKHGIQTRTHADLVQNQLSGATTPPYGMKLEKGRLIEHKGEQKIITLMKELKLDEKYTYRQIARYLNHRGTPTKCPGGKWHNSTIKNILTRALSK